MTTTNVVYQNKMQKQASPRIDFRKIRGEKLYREGHVCMGEESMWVQSEADYNIVYKIEANSCECPDFENHLNKCKHQWAAEYYVLNEVMV